MSEKSWRDPRHQARERNELHVSSSELRWVGLQRWWAICGLMLIAASWRLWIPSDAFPHIPLFEWADSPPAWLTYTCTAAMVVCLAALIGVTKRSRLHTTLLTTYLLTWAILVILNQHRLQAWSYQFALLAVAFCISPPQRGLTWIRGLVVSIYFYSALGKFDYQFIHTVGQQFLTVVCGWCGWLLPHWPLESWPTELRLGVALLFPLGELVVAILLGLPQRRTTGVCCAVFLHACLLAILGPWGLRHESGVLLWNGFFMGQAIWLFAPRLPFQGQSSQVGAAEPTRPQPQTSLLTNSPADQARQPEVGVPLGAESPRANREQAAGAGLFAALSKRSGRLGPRFLAGVVRPRRMSEWLLFAAMVMPMWEPWGVWDHWPSWGLYSPRNSRVQLEVHRSEWKRLPRHLQQLGRFASASQVDERFDPWVQVDLGAWSLNALQVPIYPQQRFQLGVATSFLAQGQLDRGFRLQLLGMSNRWTGERSTTTLRDRMQLDAAARRYWFHAQPNDIQ